MLFNTDFLLAQNFYHRSTIQRNLVLSVVTQISNRNGNTTVHNKTLEHLSHLALPKLHLLEDHEIPRAKEWHVGFGLLGEQVAELIHAWFNTLQRTYHPMQDKSPAVITCSLCYT